MEVVLRVARLRLLPRILPHASSSLLRILDLTRNAAGTWANALMQDTQWLNTRVRKKGIPGQGRFEDW
eukprot:8089704-Pyramimonas_sp.AAC.1